MARRAASLALAAALLTPALSSAATLAPPGGEVFFGVSDRGTSHSFFEFSELVGKHPALLETFHPWGNSLEKAFERWRETAVRPVLHISTMDDRTGAELITPEQIALGDGDGYLLELNSFFAEQGLRAYIRPMGEPNRCLNAYSAVNCDGSLKGGEHSTYWYKQAFRRIVTIVRGGGSLEEVDATLAAIGLPPVHRSHGQPPSVLPPAPVAFIWSPLPSGSPRVRGNYPGNYWPGGRWVDWAGTDFYSNYPVWGALNRFFRRRAWRHKPFTISEWAVAGKDEPRFARRLIKWVLSRRRVRMMIYYRGFGDGSVNPYGLALYPRTTNLLRRQLRRPAFPAYAWENASTLPPLPVTDAKTTPHPKPPPPESSPPAESPPSESPPSESPPSESPPSESPPSESP